MQPPRTKSLAPVLLALTLLSLVPETAAAQTEIPRSSWLRSPIGGSIFFRAYDPDGRELTCERTLDGAQRCVTLAAPRLRRARALVGIGSYLTFVGGTVLMIGSLMHALDCDPGECVNGSTVIGGGAILAGSGIGLLSLGAVRVHRFNDAMRVLLLTPYIASPPESAGLGGAVRAIPGLRAPAGLGLTLRF